MKFRFLSFAILLSLIFCSCSENSHFDSKNGSDDIFIESEESNGKENYDYDMLQFKNASGKVVLDGRHVKAAEPQYITDEHGELEIIVKLVFTDEGSALFAEASKIAANDGTAIDIYFDDTLISSPTVSAEYAETGIVGGVALISGEFNDFDEAYEMCETIKKIIN